jgi:hypothetical protein
MSRLLGTLLMLLLMLMAILMLFLPMLPVLTTILLQVLLLGTLCLAMTILLLMLLLLMTRSMIRSMLLLFTLPFPPLLLMVPALQEPECPGPQGCSPLGVQAGGGKPATGILRMYIKQGQAVSMSLPISNIGKNSADMESSQGGMCTETFQIYSMAAGTLQERMGSKQGRVYTARRVICGAPPSTPAR